MIFGYTYKARKRREWLGLAMVRLSAAVVVAALLLIVGFLFYNGWTALSWEFLTEFPRNSMTEGGIWPAIVGTFLLGAGSMLVAMPVGCGAAIYLAEYARPGPLLSVIRLGITSLAGVPSVVFGIFGMAFFVLKLNMGVCLLAGSLTLAILILPTIISAAEEALKQVPPSYREAAVALGATRWQAVRQVVLPMALPNILTGGILAMGRATGETAPIMFTAVTFYTLSLPGSAFDQIMALPYHIYVLATAGTHIEQTRHLQYGTVLVLMCLVLGMSLLAIIIRTKLRRSKSW